MPRGKVLSDVEKGQILVYADQNKNLSEIAKTLKRSRCVIRSFLQNKEKYGTIERSGRKKKLSAREEAKIVRAASGTTKSCRELAQLTATKISKCTAWRTLQRCPYIVRQKMKSAPNILPEHKEARLVFAQANMATNWTNVNWNQILFFVDS